VIIEPSTPYLHNWHIDMECEYLEAVAAGDIRFLALAQAPRSMKSIMGSVMFPCWEWTQNPGLRYLFVSYSATLSTKHSLDRRRIIQSEWYQRNWGDRVRLVGDMNAKTQYENSARGAMIATSIGAVGTGLGGNRVILDDPINPKQAYSEADRVTAHTFVDVTLPSRLNDKKRDAEIIIAQRIHEDDVTGHLLAREGDKWTYVAIPAEAPEDTEVVFPRSGRIVHRKAGDILWEEREGRAELNSMKIAMGSRDYEAQFNQNPAPAEGGLFKTEWFRYYLKPPVLQDVIQSWDMAFKGEDDSDWVVGQCWGRAGSEKYLLGQVRAQADFPATVRMVRLLTAQHPQASAKLIEDAANGPAVIATLKREISGIIAVTPKGGKAARAAAVSATCEAGNVYLPALCLDPLRVEPWVESLLDEVSRFPGGKNDDQVDAMTQALARLNKPLLVATTTEG
jgi:predicted phage terminase large subunit-like protein